MSQPAGGTYQIQKSLTVSTASIQGQPWYTGDFKLLQVSCSTQSNNAINIQGNNGDGFQAALIEAEWRNILPISVQSIHNIAPIPRWSRASSPANSNATIIFHGVW